MKVCMLIIYTKGLTWLWAEHCTVADIGNSLGGWDFSSAIVRLLEAHQSLRVNVGFVLFQPKEC
ncbi:hypothetical protein RUM43_012718 [Polyplax serrata]|uniref:Uncharacterized protein n=1 Tax=Polyplax serrata TaxID=468196 RepID=A0AAN8PI34_POLSC